MIKNITAYLKQFNRNLWILSIGWFVSSTGFAVSIPFISIYFYSDLGLSMSQIGFFFGAMAVIRSLFQAVGGEISDRIERRFLLIYSQMIRSVVFFLLACSIYYDWGFWAISVCLVFNAIFGAIFQPVANAMVSDILPASKRLDGYAITRSAGNLGWAAGPAIGGFFAGYSYALLFVISTIVTFISSMIFLFFLKSPKTLSVQDRFKFSDLLSVRNDPFLGRHTILIFLLYLVVAQLMAPFSVYAVEMVKISEHQLGLLYTINGLMVVLLQVPVTKLLSKYKLTIQLAVGAFIYAVGYGMVGTFVGFNFFALAMIVITTGEIFMSPPALTLTSNMAPEGRMGRYMGIYGFAVASGWSFGPLYGGVILDYFGDKPQLAWILISSLAVISGIGYLEFSRKLPDNLDLKQN